jgi:alkylation response protein AidB-like acyl-CoA dehydrogenase
MNAGPRPDIAALAHELGSEFASHVMQHDADDSFVSENYERLRQAHVFSLGIPAELGGGGASFPELCELLRVLGSYCGSTALALSMHTHLVAATVWRWRHGDSNAETLLRKIADKELILVSTGGSDWVAGSGKAEAVQGGYLITARKIFGSGAPAGDLLLTMAVYEDPAAGPTVLHFAVPLHDEHVKIQDNWHAMGMRGTGSNDILIEGFFVPDSAISLRRPAGQWHRFWDIITPLVWPLVMSAYLGVAESARSTVLKYAQMKKDDAIMQLQVGEMETHMSFAQLAHEGLVALAHDYDYEPTLDRSNRTFMYKTLLTRNVLAVVQEAMEIMGGSSFFRDKGLERLFRDVEAAQFHPLQEKKQYMFSGRLALDLNPVS